MGYDIYIGDGKMEPLEEDEGTSPHSRIVNGKVKYYDIVVKEVKLPDAPVFPNDDMTGNSNNRHPGYGGWSDFCERTGLYDLFFNEECGLMREHPGFQALHIEHATTIQSALNDWKASHPDTTPGFEAFSWRGEEVPVIGYDHTLARLIWLNWWVQWAIKNCEHAGIYNF